MISWTIEKFDIVDSTMNIIHDRGRNGAGEGLVITAKQQSSGRGRNGNKWIAPQGNLYCSILLRPRIHAKDAGQYSFMMAVALARAFSKVIVPPHKFQHKWPNDVLIDQKKGAGILLESDINPDGTLSYLNIGIGVNIANAPPERICLHDVSEGIIDTDYFLDSCLSHLNNIITEYNKNGFSLVRDEWLLHAYGINKPICVRLPNEVMNGLFLGLRDDGALHLQTDDGKSIFISSGEVFFG